MRNLKTILSWCALTLVYLIAAYYIICNPEQFSFIAQLTIGDIAILSVITIGLFVAQGLLTKFYLDSFAVRLRFSEWFGLECVVALINYLPIRPGIFSKALYLKNKHNFAYARFASFIAALNLIILFCVGLVGCVSVYALYYNNSIFHNSLAVLFIALLLSTLFLVFIPTHIPQQYTKNKFMKFIHAVFIQWNQLKQSPATFAKLIAVQIIILLLCGLRLFYIFKLIASPLPLLSCIIIALLSTLAIFVPLLPSSLGVKEGVIAMAAKLVGNSIKEGITGSLVDRAISMGWTFLLGGIFLFLLVSRKKRRATL